MTLLSLCLLGLVAYLTWRWLSHDSQDSPLDSRFPGKSIALLLTLAGLSYLPVLRVELAADRAGRAVSAVVGERVEYRCGSVLNVFFDRDTDLALGYVRRSEGHLEKTSKLRYDVCNGLMDYLSDPQDLQTNGRAKILAVHVLTHEARHMVGEYNEAAAECQAVQRSALVAEALGASSANARELARRYFDEHYARQRPGYWSAECRRGGSLDEDLPTSPWNLSR